jgi:hypothetical protein
MSESFNPDQLLLVSELADLLNVSDGSILALTREGILDAEDDRYPLAQSVRSYAEFCQFDRSPIF